METKVRGRVRVILDADDVALALAKYKEKHSNLDSVLNYALDKVRELGDNQPRVISHRLKLPESAIVNFRLGGRD